MVTNTNENTSTAKNRPKPNFPSRRFLFSDKFLDLGPINPIQPNTLINLSSNIAGSNVIDADIMCLIGDDFVYKENFENTMPK